jgi:hypothetical protein
MALDSFSYAVDIKRFQNLLETSVDVAERKTLQRLLTAEQAKSATPTKSEMQVSEPQKK